MATTGNGVGVSTVAAGIWRGRPVPPALALWFDQLMDKAEIVAMVSAQGYIDVTLTLAPNGGFAKPPIFTIK